MADHLLDKNNAKTRLSLPNQHLRRIPHWTLKSHREAMANAETLARFQNAVMNARQLPPDLLTNSQKLKVYALYKQTEKPAPEETASGLWNIRITGEPDVSILFGLHEPDGWTARTTAEMLGVAGAVTNAIPHVIAAAPGVAETPPFVAWRAPEQAREIVA